MNVQLSKNNVGTESSVSDTQIITEKCRTLEMRGLKATQIIEGKEPLWVTFLGDGRPEIAELMSHFLTSPKCSPALF